MSYRRFCLVLIGWPLLVLTMFRPVQAAPIPVERVVREMQTQTDLPIWLPDAIPEMEQVYVSFYFEPNSYLINFDYTADCGGSTACLYGYLSAERNGQFSTAADLSPLIRPGIPRDEIVPVQLANDMSGQFVNTCGPYCMATVQWKLGGILYSAAIKNGTQANTVALANAILQSGVRAQSTVIEPSSSNQTLERVFVSASGETTVRIVQKGDWEQSGATIGSYQQQDGSGGYLTNTGQDDPMGFYTRFYDTSGSERCVGQMHLYIDDGGFSYGSRATWRVEGAAPGYACSTVGQTLDLKMQQAQ